ncbi:FG-GAP repeat protein [Nostoc sp. FACHB-888]|uniref:beta strand repeat-containing protein n=1 Tax=Nostoc sp. FACHB-888 TaxID=2692842 RepID=UPI0016878E03|nr:FG-GAP repeat protein [Nostoc sp. FACHB-888]MBD2245217.1 FG-GAP repeat protein [Nostoc sp. FACHB-888]
MANAVLNLSELNGSNGFVINGIDEGDLSGSSVSSAGDINDDGFDDLIIAAFSADPNGQISAGENYVVFGSSSGFGASLNLSSLNGSNGFVINGINAFDFASTSVSSAGDINDDGFDDLIIGAYNANTNDQYAAGQSYVVFGSSSDFGASFNLSSLNGSNGFVINGVDAFDFSGDSVSSAGDINGDGFDDLIIGAKFANPNGQDAAGKSYVVFGNSSGFGASFNLSSLNGSNGFVINGIDEGDSSGDSVSSAGDINGDGFDDLIIGAPSADPNGDFSGQSYVVFGNSSGFDAQLNLSSLNGSNGFVINGIDEGDSSGSSVSSAGDINRDGFDDLIIGGGGSYVVFGSNSGFSAQLNLSSLNGSNGFVINVSGSSVSGAGDINGDGFDDLIIGAPSANPNGNDRAGESYVVFGSSSSFGASFNLSSLNGSDGFAINGIDEGDSSGSSVSGAGDINGDGFDDLIIGASSADPNGNDRAGESYVVFGFASPTPTNKPLVANITGNEDNDTISGNGGNDTISGNGGNDTISGNGGNDTITDFAGTGIGLNPSAAVITQLDTLQFIGSGLIARNLQLTQNGNNLELTFLDAASTKVTLQNFQLENLDNLPADGSRPAIGNILFDGQRTSTDSFDVFNANSTQTNLFNKSTVTFLNDLNNNVAGFDNSNDVINAQGGNDIINGNSGDDLLRGGSGDDILIGGFGNDSLVGGRDNDILIGGVGADFFLYNSNADFSTTVVGIDAIADFNASEGDKIVLDKTTFSAITSAAGTGLSNQNDFQITNLARISTAKIVYDPVSGQLFYNQNGSTSSFGSGGLFATLTGAPTLTASDFILQA